MSKGEYRISVSYTHLEVYKRQVKKAALSGKPFLGICLGLQLLFAESDESPDASGLGLLNGNICLLYTSYLFMISFKSKGFNSFKLKW